MCRDEYYQLRGGPADKSGKNAKQPLELLKVSVEHVSNAFDEMSKSNIVRVMRGLRKFEVLVLVALFLEQKEEKVSLDAVQDRCDTVLVAMQQNEASKTSNQHQVFTQLPDQEEHPDAEYEPVRDLKPVEYKNWHNSFLTTSMFREIVKRLQAYGLINMIIDSHKLTDNAFASHYNFFDFVDLRNAFHNNEVYKVQERFILLNSSKA